MLRRIGSGSVLLLGMFALGSTEAAACDWGCWWGCPSYAYYAAPAYGFYARPSFGYYAPPPAYYAPSPAYYAPQAYAAYSPPPAYYPPAPYYPINGPYYVYGGDDPRPAFYGGEWDHGASGLGGPRVSAAHLPAPAHGVTAVNHSVVGNKAFAVGGGSAVAVSAAHGVTAVDRSAAANKAFAVGGNARGVSAGSAKNNRLANNGPTPRRELRAGYVPIAVSAAPASYLQRP